MTACYAVRRGVGSGVSACLLALLLPVVLAAQAPAPLEVLSRDELRQSGRTELAQILEALLPSFNYPRPSIAGGSDHVRPATLRGLGADQWLVLVNGRRRHESALINVHQGIGRGQGMVDLNAIPVSAIERIEILGQAGAPRYGSGAVAGVINIVLVSTSEPGLSATAGTTTAGDGTVLQAGGNYRLRWGGDGLVQVAAEVRSRGATNRALPDLRPQYFPGDPKNSDPAFTNRVTQRYGDPEAQDVAGFLTLEKRLLPALGAYGFAELSRRSGEAGELWRRPSENGTVRAIYPNGFLPLITPKISDGSAAGGLRGSIKGWSWDVSLGYARSSVRFDLEHSANVSLGTRSPTEFYAGTLRADQLTAGMQVTHRLIPGVIPPLLLELGGSHRSDGYQIRAGEPDSYRYGAVPIQDGPNAGGVPPIGAQGFPGFRPTDATTRRRGMLAGYGEISTLIFRKLSLAATGGVEYYHEHGALWSYQLAARLEPLQGVELFASSGTGLRVPSLGQSWFSSSATNIIGRFGFEDRTVPVADPLAVVLGARPLRPERSRNLSLGAAVRPLRPLTVGVDYYRINVADRVILSGTFDDIIVQDFLARQNFFGIGGVRFFSNGIATRTSGIDARAAYRLGLGAASLLLRGTFNHNSTRVVLVDSLAGPLAGFQQVFFGRMERARIERGQPRDNLIVASELTHRAWSIALRSHWFGAVTSYGAPPDGSLDQSFGAKWISDLSVSHRTGRGLTLTLGADNLLNVYPDRQLPGDASREGSSYFGMFPYSGISPFGFNGRYVYLRAAWRY